MLVTLTSSLQSDSSVSGLELNAGDELNKMVVDARPFLNLFRLSVLVLTFLYKLKMNLNLNLKLDSLDTKHIIIDIGLTYTKCGYTKD
jgi:hypothetical protein